MMLRIDEYRHAFVNVDGISMIIQVLPGKVGFQIQYQLTFCLWCMTFNPELAEKMNKYNVIPILADILGESVKEKVTRIILATFRFTIKLERRARSQSVKTSSDKISQVLLDVNYEEESELS
ncbi:V-type proton ATPase subunit H-like [Lingula anatina]|uniref:V-type proton ATPase subunit H-like n=1 Tax=Lingula anatina TaxID=7574 RepID=A0A1S3H602_LINAN|nr:V-type proton ATPase subunit H-like [Lingula anatina]|eukprot:XP_013380554.1 V-type proton ATPase subunit H-like [Lingula anatina]